MILKHVQRMWRGTPEVWLYLVNMRPDERGSGVLTASGTTYVSLAEQFYEPEDEGTFSLRPWHTSYIPRGAP
jgi:hypothetical protein